ncbi:Poly(3-hydroxyalkanoate) polymerase subunit PhaE [Candidatus Magnetomoraceae bacterium gMMP-15]
MNNDFLKFLGNFLISAAESKKQLDDISEWIKKTMIPDSSFGQKSFTGFEGFEDLTAMFQQFYGLDKLSERSDEYKQTFEKAAQNFQKSFKDNLALLGIVSGDEHLKIVEKYENLKKKCADQEETIKHLQMLLQSKGMKQVDIVKNLQDMMAGQSKLFKNVIESFESYLTGKSDSGKSNSGKADSGKADSDKADSGKKQSKRK